MIYNDLLLIQDGGERLYIHPYSVDENNSSNNKIHYFDNSEFPMYESGEVSLYLQIFKHYNNWFKRLYYLHVKRLLVAIKRGWRYRLIGHCWRVGEPFIAASVCPVILSGQNIQIVDTEEITDTYYLTPSQKKLEEMVNLYLCENWNWSHPPCQEFGSWKLNELMMGRTIFYLCSLDT